LIFSSTAISNIVTRGKIDVFAFMKLRLKSNRMLMIKINIPGDACHYLL
jgi:hypothetical protein